MDLTRAERRAAGRFAGTSAIGLTVLVVGGLVFAGLLWALAEPLAALDRAVADAVNGLVAPRPWLVAVLGAVTVLGAGPMALAVLATLAVALLARRQHRLALYVAVAGAGGSVISPAVKEVVGRLRPVVAEPVASAPGWSFPSGHTFAVTLWVGVVLLVLLPAVPLGARRVAVATGVTVVVLVGLTRVGLGVHYLGDVVAGWLLGLAWLAVTVAAFRAWLRTDGRADTPLSGGLDPDAAPDLAPAPDHEAAPDDIGRRAAQLLVVAVLLLGLVLAAGWLVTKVEVGTPVEAADDEAARWFAAQRTDVLDAVSEPVGELGNTGVVIAIGSAAVVLGLAVLRRVRPALLLTVALVGQLLLFMTAVTIIGRPRPPVPHLDAELPPTSSFPSGHVGAAIALYGGIAVLVLAATQAWWRWLVLALAVTVVVLVAASRLYRGAHHPTDVLGSVLLAVPWLLATARLLPPGRGADARRTPRRPAPAAAER